MLAALGLRDHLAELAVADLGGERVAAWKVGAAMSEALVGDDLVKRAGGGGVALIAPRLQRHALVLEVLGGVLEVPLVVDDRVDLVLLRPLAGHRLDVGERHLVALGRHPDPPDHVVDVVGRLADQRQGGGVAS